MTAPWFRFLTREELAKLTIEEHIAYTAAVIEHVRHGMKDRQKAIDARDALIESKKAEKRPPDPE